MYRTAATAATMTRGGSPTDNVDYVVSLDQVPRWSDAEYRSSLEFGNEDPSFSTSYFPDPLTSSSGAESSSNDMVSRFPVDHEINSKIYLWRGNPWNLEVDAVVNSTNEVSQRVVMRMVYETTGILSILEENKLLSFYNTGFYGFICLSFIFIGVRIWWKVSRFISL